MFHLFIDRLPSLRGPLIRLDRFASPLSWFAGCRRGGPILCLGGAPVACIPRALDLSCGCVLIQTSSCQAVRFASCALCIMSLDIAYADLLFSWGCPSARLGSCRIAASDESQCSIVDLSSGYGAGLALPALLGSGLGFWCFGLDFASRGLLTSLSVLMTFYVYVFSHVFHSLCGVSAVILLLVGWS